MAIIVLMISVIDSLDERGDLVERHVHSANIVNYIKYRILSSTPQVQRVAVQLYKSQLISL